MEILGNNAQREIFDKLGVDLPTSSVADEFRERARQNSIKSLYYFSTAVLGWNKLQPNPHLPLCTFIQAEEPRRKVVLIPRDTYKSTIGSKSLPLWILIQPSFCGIPGLEHRILLASHSSENAKKQIKSLRQQVERNTVLQWLFPEIIPPIANTTWTDTNLLFPRQGVYGEDTIECGGIDTHLVSRHYTIQIKDDIEDEAAMLSPSVRERVKSWYRSAEALFVDERTAFDLLIGTRWGIDDVYSGIMRDEAETYTFYVRPLHWTREELVADIREAQLNKVMPVWNMDPDTFAPEPDKTYFFFPNLFPAESCKRVRDKQGSFMYSMLYLNNPKDPTLAEFREKDLRYFVFDDEGNILTDGEDGTREVIPYDALRRVEFWDPALSEKEKKNCRNAIVVMGRDPHGRLFVIDAYADWKSHAFLFSKFIGMFQRWRCHKAGIEDVAFQRVLKFPLYQRMRELDVHFPVAEQRPIGSKEARIRSLIPFCESHMLFVRRGLKDFVDELLGFPLMPLKDLVDAAAACIGLFGLQPLQSSSPRQLQRMEDLRLSTRSKVTGY